MSAAFWKGRQASDDFLDAVEDMLGLGRSIMLGTVAVDFFEVASGILGQQYLETHQTRGFLPRRRLMTCDAGTTLPSSICLFPRARILRSAIVSCVSS